MSQVPPETRIDGERVYDGHVVKLDVDHIRTQGGGEGRREVIRHPGAAAIVPLLPDGSVVMVRQWRYCTGGELLEIPAGTMDHPGEEPLACAKRELGEEVLLAAESWDALGSFYTTPGFTTEVIHAFLARDLADVSGFERDVDEYIEIVTVPLAAALGMAQRGEIRDAKSIVSLYLASAFMDRQA